MKIVAGTTGVPEGPSGLKGGTKLIGIICLVVAKSYHKYNKVNDLLYNQKRDMFNIEAVSICKVAFN